MRIFLDEEQFVVGLVGWQETNAAAIQRRHLQDRMFLGMVVFLDPVSELAVERLEAGQIQGARKELLADGAKKSFDFSLGRSVPHGGMGQERQPRRAQIWMISLEV